MVKREYESFIVHWEDGTKSRESVSVLELNADRKPIQVRESLARIIISQRSGRKIASIEPAYDD